MPRPIIIICIDGFDPDYLEAAEMPNLREIGRKGFMTTGRSMMPSVTNVNNVSIVTASYPAEHGICSNYRWDRETGEGFYMESAENIRSLTMFRRADELGMTSIVVTAKDKLRTLVGVDATTPVSSERAPDWITAAVGDPPEVYSLEVNGWVIDVGNFLMKQRPVDIAYLTTTDFAMHMNPPDHPDAIRHMAILDDAIGRIAADHPDATILITADHGMNQKTEMVDLKAILSGRGIESNPVAIIKDRYVLHHSKPGRVHVHLPRSGERQRSNRNPPRHARSRRRDDERGGSGTIRSQAGRYRRYRGDGLSAGRFRRCRRGLDSRRPSVPRLRSRARHTDRRVQRRFRRLRVSGEPRRRPLPCSNACSGDPIEALSH